LEKKGGFGHKERPLRKASLKKERKKEPQLRSFLL